MVRLASCVEPAQNTAHRSVALAATPSSSILRPVRAPGGGSGVWWRARQNYDVTKHLHVWIVRPGERVADMHPFSYGLHERRTAHRHAVTLDREAGAHVWSCSDVACLLDSQRIQALDSPHDWAHYTEQRRPLAGRVSDAGNCHAGVVRAGPPAE